MSHLDFASLERNAERSISKNYVKNCLVTAKKCVQRHPKECKFLQNIGYRKFGEWCLLSHNIKKDPNIENLEMENKNVRNNLEKLEKLIDEKDKQMENIIESMLHKFRKLE